jgi:hypothetical protein
MVRTAGVLTHVCALTPDGHVVRLGTPPLGADPRVLKFLPLDSSNLHTPDAPHMRRVVVTFIDGDHFSGEWTKTEGREGHGLRSEVRALLTL